jgi:plastocyanin
MAHRLLRPVALLLFVACGGGDAGMSTRPTPTPPTASNAVDVRDNLFDPSAISAVVASAVIWTWRGSAQHNVTFEDDQGSSTTKASGSHQRAFAAAGTYRYRCTIHSSNFTSGMVGSVVVK